MALGLCLWGISACCVTPPTADELLEVGFRSPAQSFRTFQTASTGDLPDLEFRCLSRSFRSRNELSKFAYLEFREKWYRSEPLLRYAIDKAEIVSEERHGTMHARLVARSLGTTLSIDLLREDFYEIWTENGLLDSDDLPFEQALEAVEAPDGSLWLIGRAPLPGGLEHDDPETLRIRMSEFSFRREWKIDGFQILEKDPREDNT